MNAPSARSSVAILMGTYNGASYLEEQLQSFVDQTFPDWSVYISDDGSTDATHDIIRRFAESTPHRVDLQIGPKQGFVENYLSLARNPSIDAPLFAYSDQDDIWYPDKLARAVAWFESLTDESTPAVYISRTELVEADGKHRGYSTLFRRPPGFRNALVQSIGGANTMVFNRAARRLVQAAANCSAASHDWCIYLLVTAVDGNVYYDSEPTLKYRQHDNNAVGSNRGIGASAKRLGLMLHGELSRWNSIHQKLLQSVESHMPVGNRETLRLFSEARAARFPARLRKLNEAGVYRQTMLGDLGLALAALLGKI